MRSIERRPVAIPGLLLVFLTMLLLTHPYGGIEGDGIIYTMQALYKLDPARFRHDLFFEFGSQTDRSIFAFSFGKAVSVFGIVPAYRFALAAAQLLWWSGAYRLIRRLLPAPWHWMCLVFVAGMPAQYATTQFSYDETFLSARLPAEALALWAIAFSLERRPFAAFLVAGLACAIHPLMGAVGFAAVLFNAMPRVPWWRLFALGLTVFALVELLPLNALILQPFDPEWLALSRYNIAGLFLSEWGSVQWSGACWVIALSILVSAVEPPSRRRFWELLALVGTAGVTVSAVADLAGRDVVWIQLQTWRTLWLLTFMQWPACAILFWRLRREGPLLLWLLAICWLLLSASGGMAALVLASALKLAAIAGRGRFPSGAWMVLTPLRRFGFVVATGFALAGWFRFEFAYQGMVAYYLLSYRALRLSSLELFLHTHLVIVIILTLIALSQARSRPGRVVFALLVAALLAYGAVNADQRLPFVRLVEARCDEPHLAPFPGRIRPGQTVYWDGPAHRLLYTWFLLRTPSYFSPWQSVGGIFNRGTLFESLRRDALIQGRPSAGRPEGDNIPFNRLLMIPGNPEPLSAMGIVRVCGDPRVDFVVSPKKPAGIESIDVWAPTDSEKYWLIDCTSVRGMHSGT